MASLHPRPRATAKAPRRGARGRGREGSRRAWPRQVSDGGGSGAGSRAQVPQAQAPARKPESSHLAGSPGSPEQLPSGGRPPPPPGDALLRLCPLLLSCRISGSQGAFERRPGEGGSARSHLPSMHCYLQNSSRKLTSFRILEAPLSGPPVPNMVTEN